tara:strand:+ start:268 stop:429 length:162 start_codon:yes stop_codon:yes gene_type:complete
MNDLILTNEELNFLLKLVEEKVNDKNINLLHQLYKKLLFKQNNLKNNEEIELQ